MTFWVAGAAVVGGALQSSATKSAAKTQAASTEAAIAEQQRQYDVTREDYAPYRQTGRYALERLIGSSNLPVAMSYENFDHAAYLRANPDVAAAGMDPFAHYEQYGRNEGRAFTFTPEAQARQQAAPVAGEMDRAITPEEVMSDPGYQFGLKQGQLALDRKTAAAGGRVSGAALKAASEYATNYATTGYGAAYQRRQDRLNRLAALAGIGQTATGGSAAAGTAAARNISGMIGAQGEAGAAAQLARGNIWGGAINQLGAVGERWATAPTASTVQMPTSPYTGYTGDYNALAYQP